MGGEKGAGEKGLAAPRRAGTAPLAWRRFPSFDRQLGFESPACPVKSHREQDLGATENQACFAWAEPLPCDQGEDVLIGGPQPPERGKDPFPPIHQIPGIGCVSLGFRPPGDPECQ